MLTIKRIITSVVLFFPFSIFLYFGILILGAGIVGGIAGAQDPENAAAAGELAGMKFAENYIVIISFASLGLSIVFSLLISFGGLLPWCKNKPVIDLSPS